MKPLVLLSGFEAFAGDLRNPSQDACALLDGSIIAAHRIVSIDLPVTFSGAWRRLEAGIRHHDPALVLATGLWASRSDLSIERIALNFVDARIPDNRGQQPRERPIIAGAQLAYPSRLPVGAVVNALKNAHIPATASLSAGAFVCNFLYYRLAHALQSSRRRYGFVHVPAAAEHHVPGASGAMPLATIAEGIRQVIATTLAH